MQANDMKDWECYTKACTVEVVKSGLIVRNKQTCSLLCDLPLSTISDVHFLSDTLVRIHPNSSSSSKTANSNLTLAVQTTTAADGEALRAALRTHSFPCKDKIAVASGALAQQHRDALLYPDLEDAAVQEYILRLLFSEEFCEFTEKMGTLVEGLRGQLDKFDS